MADVERIKRRFEDMKSERGQWESHWQECADFVLPRRGFFTEPNASPGQKLNTRIYDGTAGEANELLASGLHGMLTSPTEIWFELTVNDEELAQRQDVIDWLFVSTRRMHDALNRSNFQTEVHEVYLDLGAFGTTGLFIEEDPRLDVVFAAWPLNELYIDENARGLIDTVYRCFEINALKASERQRTHGWTLSPRMLEAVQAKKNGQCFKVIHAIEPRDVYNPRYQDRLNMPISSCYVVPDEKHVLLESGYNEFPGAFPRWAKASGEKYGRSPTMKALADIKMLNDMSKTTIRAAQKVVDPSLIVADDGVLLPIDTRPAGLNFARMLGDGSDPIRPLKTGGDIGLGLEMEEQRRQAIRTAYYVDHLQLGVGPQMTATEVLQRTEDKLRLMGPMLGRQHFEFLRPVIDRVFSILLRRGRLPPTPDVLQERGNNRLDVVYVSPIAKAQKATQALGGLRALNTVAPLFELDPSLRHNIDGNRAVRDIMDAYSVGRWLRPERRVAELQQADAEAASEELQRQAVNEAIESAGKAAPALQVLQGGAAA